jgi:hypothetical protein
MISTFSRMIFAGMVAAVLAGCSSDKGNNCPTMAAITDAASQTVFRSGTTPDPSNVLYTVDIVDVKGSCDIDKHNRSCDANLEVRFHASRAPNGGEAHYTAGYFVAVTEGERILTKEHYTIDFAFAPGQSTTTFSDLVKSTHIQPEKDKYPFDYQILVGLQLTKEQIEFNRSQGHYGS